MKIAFVGKGGSGKSTLAALFITYLSQQGKNILAIDADINVHLAGLINGNLNKNLAVSLPDNSAKIRKYLAGTNPRIPDSNKMIKTTPPGQGSHFITMHADNPVIQQFAVTVQDSLFFMHVGTYDEEGIGESCYHNNLVTLENILSHTVTNTSDDFVVTDMVAGTDAFAGSLYTQFDLIVLVVEPTPESVGVFEQYQQLAKVAGVEQFIAVIGNKIEDDSDYKYLKDTIGDALIGYIKNEKTIRKARQNRQSIQLDDASYANDAWQNIIAKAQENSAHQDTRLTILHDLHRKHSQADYIINRHGNLVDQIDPTFSYNSIPKL